MDIRELKYFLAVAREENLSRAAEYLYITQPSLTRQIQNLEKEIGRPLFVRGGRKMTLTETGIMLRKRAEEIVELYDKAQADLILPEIISGTVNIGGGESYAFKIIADIAKSVRTEYPDIKFNIFSGNTDDVCEKLDKGLFDFGILVEPANLTKYDYLHLPHKDTWGLLMRKDAPLADREFIVPADVSGAPLIFSKHAFHKNTITEWFQTDIQKLNVVTTYNLLYNASLMVEAGVGYAVSLDRIVNNDALVFRPFFPKLESNLDIVWKKYQLFSNASRVFLDKLQETLHS